MFLFNSIRFLFKKTTRPPPPETPEVWGVNQMTSRGVGTNKDVVRCARVSVGNFFLVAFRKSTYIQYIYIIYIYIHTFGC